MILLVAFEVAFAVDIKYVTHSFITNPKGDVCYDADGVPIPCGNETVMQVSFYSSEDATLKIKLTADIDGKQITFVNDSFKAAKGWNYLLIGEFGIPGSGTCTYNLSFYKVDGLVQELVKTEEIHDRCYKYVHARKWKKVEFLPIPIHFTFGEVRLGKKLINSTEVRFEGINDKVWLYIKNYSENGKIGYFAESCTFYPNCTNKSCQELLKTSSEMEDLFSRVIEPLIDMCGTWSSDVWPWMGISCSPSVPSDCFTPSCDSKGWVYKCPVVGTNGLCFFNLSEHVYGYTSGSTTYWSWPIWMNNTLDPEEKYGFGEECANYTVNRSEIGKVTYAYPFYGACKDNQRCEYQTWRVYRYHYNWTISYDAMITVENRNETALVPLGYNQTSGTQVQFEGKSCSGDNICFTKLTICGDGVCDFTAGEKCWNCPEDCGCDTSCAYCPDDYTGLVDESGCLKRKAGLEELCLCDSECGTAVINGKEVQLKCVKKQFKTPNSGITEPPEWEDIEPKPYGRCLPDGYWWDPYHNGSDFGGLPDNESIPGVGRVPRGIEISCSWSSRDAWWVCTCLGHLRQAQVKCTITNHGTKPENVSLNVWFRPAHVSVAWFLNGGCDQYEEIGNTYTTLVTPGDSKVVNFKIECGGPGYCQQVLAPVSVSCPNGTALNITASTTLINAPFSNYPIYMPNDEWQGDLGACGCSGSWWEG